MAKLFHKYRDVVPNFNDPSAVIREYEDSKGDLQKIEVFYGGRYGGDSEGHGHWIAENIDGIFQVTLDRNPDGIDGGAHLIESIHRTDAYSGESRSERIANKEAVIAELLLLSSSAPDLEEKVKQLKQKFYDCGSCGKADNDRLKARFESAADSLFKARSRKLE